MRDTKYLTLKENLLRKITRGELPAGEKIPSENALASSYNISRQTV